RATTSRSTPTWTASTAPCSARPARASQHRPSFPDSSTPDFTMATKDPARKPRLGLRMFLMLLLTLLIVGGLFAIKAVIGKQTNAFFDNMPQPAAAITTAEASEQSWSASLEAVGTLVAVN